MSRPVPRLWMAALGGETVYEVDLPACCRRDARASDGDFECPSCGAAWQPTGAAEPEVCAFTDEGEQRGAA